ncbi:MAG: FHA domain-containing protein [Anaerolineae bacterium]|nr:FHA domain-containing protein [Anaerolineae bacterium]
MVSNQVHRYNTLRWLGEGRFANVYLAEENYAPYRQVAIKVMKEELVYDERARTAFDREKEVLDRLRNNPSVVKLVGERYSFIGEQQIPYLVLSYVPGKNLIDLIHEHGPFSEEEGLRICIQACDVLCDAHELGIIHNDVKPEHFFWDGRMVSVIDWNVSKFVQPSAPSPQITAYEIPMPGAPRQERRRGLSRLFDNMLKRPQPEPAPSFTLPTPVPPPIHSPYAGDILEFGTVMYAIFTGWDARDNPATGHAEPASQRSEVSYDQTNPMRVDPGFEVTAEGITWPVYFGEYEERLSAELKGTIRQAMNPVPSSRLQSMRDMRNALAQCAPFYGDELLVDDLPGLGRAGFPPAQPLPTIVHGPGRQPAPDLSRTVRSHIAKGKSALQAEDYQDAIAEFRSALALDPGNEVATRLLAQVEREQRSQARADVPQVSLERQVRALISKGKSALNAGDHDDAIAFFEQALDLDPESEQAQRLLTQARLARKGRPPSAAVAAAGGADRYFDPNGGAAPPDRRSAVPMTSSYVLEVVEGARPGWYPVAAEARLAIGRQGRNHIVLTHWSVSRQHATLICSGGRCEIVDLKSTNGTFVNGRQVAGRQEIWDGDSVQLGQVLLKLRSATAAPPTQVIHRGG